MMEVTILAVLQGIAEFLPVSSSGHLVIGQHLLGINAPGMRLDVFLHVGTLISIFVYYASSVFGILRRREWRYALKIALSALPAVAVYFLFKDFIDGMFDNAKMVGALLMFTGAVLIGTRYLPRGSRDVSFLRALLMGAVQALALLPGVSRSGMTLAFARGGKVEPEKAAEFSFLMSAPLIAGALVIELLKSFKETPEEAASQVPWFMLLIGMAIAAVVGYFSLKILVKALKGRWFWIFGPYCLLAGLATVLFV
jgi:undecaprenyl-diphosphatase